MTANIRNAHVQTLFTLAADDLSTLQHPLPSEIFGFHAQQACEKFMKALISAKGQEYEFTHDLDKPIEALSEAGELLPALPFDILLLQPFAVQLRYTLGRPSRMKNASPSPAQSSCSKSMFSFVSTRSKLPMHSRVHE